MPSFSFQQLRYTCNEVKDHLLHSPLKRILSLPNKRWIFCFEKESLFLSLHSPYSRLHLTNKREGKIDTSLPSLKNSTLVHLRILNEDRILECTFTKEGSLRYLIVEFFDKHPNFYLTDEAHTILWALHPLEKTHYTPPSNHYQQIDDGCCLSSKELETFYTTLEKSDALEKERYLTSQLLLKIQKKEKKKKEKLEKDLVEAFDWKTVEHQGHLFKTAFEEFKEGKSKVNVWDWETGNTVFLELEKNRSPQKQMEFLFHRARKLKKSILPLQEQIAYTEKKLAHLQTFFHQLPLCSTIEELQTIQTSLQPVRFKKEKESTKELPYYQYLSTKGELILVGKNARSNHILTFKKARGNDWWLHVKDYPGSHIIIQLKHHTVPDQETLLDAMQLALYYSKVKNEKGADVCWTQKKYLSPMKGSAQGVVQLSKHHTQWVSKDTNRLSALQERFKKAKQFPF